MRGSPLLRLAIVTFLLSALLVGCHTRPPRGIAQGRVTFQGQPVTPGTIIFENLEAGVSLMAELDSDGRYEIITYEAKGLPAGKYQVAVKPKANPSDYPSRPPLVSNNDREFKEPEYPLIPKPYRSVATSGLTADVQLKGNPPFDFDLGGGT